MSNQFQYVEMDDLDLAGWDQTMKLCLNENPFAYSSWLNLVTKRWGALVNKDHSILMPLPLKRKFGLTYISQPLFTQQLGLFGTKKITEATVSQALQSIPKKFVKAYLQLNTSNHFEGLHLPVRPTYCIDLRYDHSTLSNRYHLSHKRNIAKARKQMLVIRAEKNTADFIKQFRKTTGKKDAKLKAADYELMGRIMKHSLETNTGGLLSCYDEKDELLAGLFYLRSHSRVVNLFNFSNTKGRSLNAMPMLVDQWISKFAGSKLILDFEGSSIPSLATFYSRFGAEKMLYPVYSRKLVLSLGS